MMHLIRTRTLRSGHITLRAIGTALRTWALTLAITIAFGNAAAQQHDLDYYAPRQNQTDIQLFNNVEGFHLDPGRQALKSGDFKNAIEHTEFILRYYPNHPLALDLYSQVCVKWKGHRRCDPDAVFEQAIARSPGAAKTYLVFGIHLQRIGRTDDAIQSYKRSIELEPDSRNAYYNLGLAYMSKNQPALANDAAQRAYSLGVQLPALRDKLKAVNAWRPVEPGSIENRSNDAPAVVPKN